MQWQSNAAWHRVWLQCQYDELNNNTQAMRGAREHKKEKRAKERVEEKVQENMFKLRCLEVHLWSTVYESETHIHDDENYLINAIT